VDVQDPVIARTRVAAAIIAGGEARRLGGVEKSGLLVGGRSIAERQLEVLRPRFSRVFAVAGRAEPWRAVGVEVLSDRGAPGRGPLAGLDAALTGLRDDEDAVVCVAADMPFLSGAALELLRDTAPGADAVVAKVGGHPEPLFARYARVCAAGVAAALAANRLKAAAFLATVSVHWLSEADLRAVDPSLATLANVNTAADLAAAERRTER
jgi:molybdopterin-guanine dinucleotide biosynthesis protein A